MKSMRLLLSVIVTVVLVGFSALAAADVVTDETIFYVDFAGDKDQAIQTVRDQVSGLDVIAVQVEPTSVVHGEQNPITGKASAYFNNPDTGNGNGSYLYVADHNVIDLADLSALTLEMLIRPETMKLSVLLRKTQPGEEIGYMLAMLPDGRILFQLESPYERQQIRTGAGGVAAGEWAHIAATWDGYSMRLYINGEELATGSFVDVLDGTDGHLGIGALIRDTNRSSWGQIFHGNIGEIRISNTELSPEQFLK